MSKSSIAPTLASLAAVGVRVIATSPRRTRVRIHARRNVVGSVRLSHASCVEAKSVARWRRFAALSDAISVASDGSTFHWRCRLTRAPCAWWATSARRYARRRWMAAGSGASGGVQREHSAWRSWRWQDCRHRRDHVAALPTRRVDVDADHCFHLARGAQRASGAERACDVRASRLRIGAQRHAANQRTGIRTCARAHAGGIGARCVVVVVVVVVVPRHTTTSTSRSLTTTSRSTD